MVFIDWLIDATSMSPSLSMSRHDNDDGLLGFSYMLKDCQELSILSLFCMWRILPRMSSAATISIFPSLFKSPEHIDFIAPAVLLTELDCQLLPKPSRLDIIVIARELVSV